MAAPGSFHELRQTLQAFAQTAFFRGVAQADAIFAARAERFAGVDEDALRQQELAGEFAASQAKVSDRNPVEKSAGRKRRGQAYALQGFAKIAAGPANSSRIRFATAVPVCRAVRGDLLAQRGHEGGIQGSGRATGRSKCRDPSSQPTRALFRPYVLLYTAGHQQKRAACAAGCQPGVLRLVAEAAE